MRLTLWVSSLFLIIILGGAFLFIKFTSPLEVGTIASTDDKQTALIGIGNKGFSHIKLTQVLVNNNEEPDEVKLQVSNLVDGFVLSVDENSESTKEIDFINIDDISLKPGTSPTTNFEKTNKKIANQDDIIYGINIMHSQAIYDVHLTYNYLGISFEKTIIVSNK